MILPNETMYHINLKKGDVGKYCIVPGDPGRCEKIAARFDSPSFITSNREYTSYTGTLLGEPVSVVSTGIGGPSAAIAMEELYMLGVRTFIRVGTCGGIDLSVCGGDIVIATGAVRQEGTSREYAPIEFPAVANFDAVTALVQSAKEKNASYHTGVVQSKDSFYGQHSPSRMPIADSLLEKWEAWKRLHVLASEMETAALYCTAASLGDVRCAAVFQVLWNQERRAQNLPDSTCTSSDLAIDTAVDAIKRLIISDKSK